MIQIIVIIFFIAVFAMMPKQNKAEIEASHLLIDKCQLTVKKQRNLLKQQILLEKEFNINRISSFRKKFVRLSFIGFFLSFSVGMIAAYSALSFFSDTITYNFFFASLFGFVITIGYIFYQSYQLNIHVRRDSWKKILSRIDSTIDVAQLDVKEWQKPLLEIIEAM